MSGLGDVLALTLQIVQESEHGWGVQIRKRQVCWLLMNSFLQIQEE